MQHRPATLRIWLSLATLLLAALPAPAQVDLDALEREAFRQAGHAQHEKALQLFDRVVREAVAQDPGPADLARAEVALMRIGNLCASGCRPPELVQHMEDLAGVTAGHPFLEARRRRLYSHALAEAGRTQEALRETLSLGFATSWWVLGPLENERGTGWDDDGVARTTPDLQGEPIAGKVVPVSWRRLDHVNVAGYVDLDQVMDPDDETMAYALTFVEAQQATPVALRLGSDEGVKVWVNGELLHAADVRRPARFDQDHVGVELPTGWSALLLKVAEGEGDWRFALRVTAPDGSPAQGVRWLQPGEEPPAAWPWHPEGPLGDPVQVHRGSVQALEQLDASPDAPAWAARDLGVFLASVHAHDRASRLPQEVLERAVARDPGDASSQYYLAQASRGFAERAADREENRYRAALERTLEVDPEHVVGLEALADYYAILGNLRRARELYERAIVVNPEHVPSLLGLANVLDSRDWPGAMRLQVEELARRHPDCLQVLAAQAEIRSDLDDDHGAARFQERALELQHRNDRLVYELVETYGRAGEDQEALALLQARLVLEPFEGRAYREAANLLAARDRVAEAARYLDRYLALAPDQVETLLQRARLHQRSGETAEALTLLDRILELQPGNTAAQHYLDHLQPEEAAYEERFLTDTSTIIEAGHAREHDPDEATVILLRRRVLRVHEDGSATSHVQLVQKVTGPLGVQQVSRGVTLERWGSLEIQEARVVGGDGTVRECRHSGNRVIPPPPVRVGDILDLRYRSQTRSASYFGNYFGTRLFFQDFEPIERLEYVVLSDLESPLTFAGDDGIPEPTVEEDEEEGVRITRYVAENLPRTEREPLMPPREELFPDVQISTYRDWDDFARWWWGMIRQQHNLDDDMRQQLATLTDGLSSPEQQVAAVYSYVVSNIRYVAWEFGVHGYKPYEATTIFARRFGDCKDKAILMNTLLGELGIEARPVLIRLVQPYETRGIEELHAPTVSHFNHCISRVTLPGGEHVFLDGTAKGFGYARYPPAYDQGASVVVVSESGGEVTQVPYCTPEANSGEDAIVVQLEPTGGARFSHRRSVRLTDQERWRVMLELEGERRRAMSQFYAAELAGTEVTEVTTSDLSDLNESVQVETEARIPSLARRQNGELELPVVMLHSRLHGQAIDRLTGLDRRVHDLVLGSPARDRLEVTYELPAGWRLARSPEPVALEDPHATYRLEVTDEGSRVRVTRELVSKAPRVAVEAYPAFRSFCVEVNNVERRTLRLTPREGR